MQSFEYYCKLRYGFVSHWWKKLALVLLIKDVLFLTIILSGVIQ
jgi:hypothetical protein